MIWSSILVALTWAVILSLLLIGLFGYRMPRTREFWPTFLFMCTVLFLVAWAGSLWLTPVGPLLWGAPWLSMLVLAVAVALILVSVGGSRTWREQGEQERQREQPAPGTTGSTRRAVGTFSVLFWVLVLWLGVAIALGYVFR